MTIPDEAVEAAVDAALAVRQEMHVNGTAGRHYQEIVAALEAAAPLIAAQTLREASAAYPLETAYGGAEHSVKWLTDRAKDIEAAASATASSMTGEKQ